MTRERSLLLCVFAVALVTCTDRTTEPHHLTVGVLKHSSSIPIIVADEHHLFTKHGLTVTLKEVSPSAHMPALLQRDVQILSPSSFPVIFSTAQQNPGRLMCYLVGGETLEGDSLYAIVVPRNSELHELRHLHGKTIGSSSRFVSVNLRNILAATSSSTDQQTSVRDFPDPGLLLEALRTEQIDAAVVDQPTLSSRDIRDHFRIVEPNFRARYIGNPYWSGAGIVDVEWASQNTGVFESYLDAIDEALGQIHEDPNESKRVFSQRFKLTDLAEDRIGMYLYPGARFVPPEDSVRRLESLLESNGMLAGRVDFATLFYHRAQ